VPSGPRRSALAQDRSKQTRRRLVRAALDLWTERGFETGVEDTTVDEITARAGVAKGTFYFHFAGKEDILQELGWGTAEALYEESVRSVASGRSGLVTLRQLLVSFARRIESVPRAAVIRSVGSLYDIGFPRPVPGRRYIHQGFATALEAARLQAELPDSADAEELSRMVAALAMDAALRWGHGDSRRLRPWLLARAELVIAGAGGPPSLPDRRPSGWPSSPLRR
jgi:AcrR family transcriptional regulator